MFVTMRFLISLSMCLLLLTNVSTTLSSDPCYNYNTIDDYWRDMHRNAYQYGHDDTTVEWNGWYRLYLNGESAQMSEWCVSSMRCGGSTGLYLNSSHPRLEDGVVTREVVGNPSGWWYSKGCGQYRSNPIQVKACPGDYYVYELVTPNVSLSAPSYCAVAFSSIINDPCYNYESLDRPWRATTERQLRICDNYFSWNGWYRLYHYGMNIQMAESCVNAYSCNAGMSLSLNGPHPQIEDGVVTREVCGTYYWSDSCCDGKSKPIRVKACPGKYYVYELVKPAVELCGGYCTDVSTVTQADHTTPSAMITGSSFTMSDPCSNYNILDEYWRNTHNYWYWYGMINIHDDTRVKWDGWYRLFLNGLSAQMPDWCVSYMGCGGFSSLWLAGSHPGVEDGVVTREVHGSHYDSCSHHTSNPIQVKACPGDYYVYKLTRPSVAIAAPSYCAVSFSTPSVDPCDSYTSLDHSWRATNYPVYNYNFKCDYSVRWNGWYRLFLDGQSTQMSESCVGQEMCGTYYPMWLKDPHPQLEDGVVTRHVCVSSRDSCCGWESHPIQVKACPGNYYVYEFVKPMFCSAYCAEGNTTLPIQTTAETPPNTITEVDPCHNYNVLDDLWRSTSNQDLSQIMCDMNVNWMGWYRLIIQGESVQMPDTCVQEYRCGTNSPLWLSGGHPTVEDGVVTRDVCGHWSGDCCYLHSNPIRVKACPNNYYVYEFVRPSDCFLAYCADVRNLTHTTVRPETTITKETTDITTVSFSTPTVDPCDSYTSLDEPWRATNYPVYNYNYKCDYNVNWNGWYRLFLDGQSTQMPESCVGQEMCGTYYPLFLKDPHPQLEDGVVTRHVCMSTWNGCCGYESHPIQVKACPGNYYVYEFVKPIDCAAYCAEGNTTLPIQTTAEAPPTEFITPPITNTAERDPCSALNCTEDEWCGEMNSVYGCLCNDNQTRSDPESFDFIETCESSTGSISISRCQLFEAGFSAHGLHLNDPRCRGIIQNGRVEFSFDNNGHTCGTNLVANGTHIIYENFILGAPGLSEGLISRERILQISFSCVYPQTQTLSMIEINPLESVVHKTLPAGQGMYQVRMIPYEDVGFSQPFNGSVDAELNQEIFVEVRVDGVDSRQLVTVIDTCWATPVNDPDYSLRWDLITGECPNPHDNTVNLLQNGNSTSSRFSFKMFIFNSNSTKVYLHCAVHLCLLANNSCSAHCASGYHQRFGRSLDFHDSSSISMGPFVWSDGNADK